jgi:hypothetical protein
VAAVAANSNKLLKAMRTRCSALFGAIFRHGTKTHVFAPLACAGSCKPL